MNQQERILQKAEKEIKIIRRNGILTCGKTYRAAFELAVKFTLENLWISVDESLPEFTKKIDSVQISETVLAKCASNTVIRAQYMELSGEVTDKAWHSVDAGFCKKDDKVTHWMPIPTMNNSKS